ncbi:unnamed protein product [Periconia digitata]|uniref:N-acetyltransferase domain-containing protein n=1 Tax=Periconia digitata TaxID=1303443 RepID=A0A9W4USU8_9PLEO|nr:unnamed protein product [Periconia digitata]
MVYFACELERTHNTKSPKTAKLPIDASLGIILRIPFQLFILVLANLHIVLLHAPRHLRFTAAYQILCIFSIQVDTCVGIRDRPWTAPTVVFCVVIGLTNCQIDTTLSLHYDWKMTNIFRDPPAPTDTDNQARRIHGLHQNCHLSPPPPARQRKYSTSPSGFVSIGTPSVSPYSSPTLNTHGGGGDEYFVSSEEPGVSIELQPVTAEDAEPLAILFERCFATDVLNLVAKPPHRIDPSHPLEEREWRILQYQLASQVPTSHLVKAIDVKNGGKIIGAAGFFGPGGIQWSMKGSDGKGGNIDIPSHWDRNFRAFFDKCQEEARESVLRGNHHVWELVQLYVDPVYQRKGVGRMLVDWGLKQSDEDHCPTYVEASPDSKPFYEKKGFRVRAEAIIPGVAPENAEPYKLYYMLRSAGGV